MPRGAKGGGGGGGGGGGWFLYGARFLFCGRIFRFRIYLTNYGRLTSPQESFHIERIIRVSSLEIWTVTQSPIDQRQSTNISQTITDAVIPTGIKPEETKRNVMAGGSHIRFSARRLRVVCGPQAAESGSCGQA